MAGVEGQAGGMIAVLSIAAGGALGAVARHFTNVGAAAVFGAAFPWGTVIVNIAGSFIMGLLVGLFAHMWQAPQALKLFLTVGFLGGFTTFSSFSLDAVTLYERGEALLSAGYIIGSVVLSVAALFGGLWMARMVSV